MPTLPRRLLALFLFAACLPAWAQTVVQGRGSAPVRNGDLALARWQATADALKNALESQGSTVRTGTLVSNGSVFETFSVRSDVRAKEVRVVEENRQGDQLSLRIEAELETSPAGAACAASGPEPYRKRLLFTALPLAHPEQLRRGEAANLPRALGRLLAATLPESAGDALDDDGAAWLAVDDGELRPRPTQVAALLARRRAQLLVTGMVRDLSPAAARDRLAGLLTGEERRLELELQVFEPLAAGPRASRRFTLRLPGRAMSGPLADAESTAFARSDVGQALAAGLAEVGRWLAAETACIPFGARVLRSEGGRVELDAGSGAGIKEGDGVILLRPGRDGAPATPIASATVRAVAGEKATAAVGSAVAIQAGDLALFR